MILSNQEVLLARVFNFENAFFPQQTPTGFNGKVKFRNRLLLYLIYVLTVWKTWNSSARLTPSPEPSGHPTSNEKLVHYATPPSSPTALQRASEAPFARTVPVMMESTSSRYFGNDSCQTSRDHCEFGADQRYDGLAELS